jgi:uncharacterized protein YlxW (UPF0749 family)
MSEFHKYTEEEKQEWHKRMLKLSNMNQQRAMLAKLMKRVEDLEGQVNSLQNTVYYLRMDVDDIM